MSRFPLPLQPMPRYFVKLSYFGRDFNGWQIQKNSANTVQEVMQKAMGRLLKEKTELVGCGRTDTGVNARNFIAHFDSIHDLLSRKEYWLAKFNAALPKGISADDLKKVADDVHARYNAVERMYHYFIITAKDPFLDPYAWHIHAPLDFLAMNEAASALMEYSDFTSFSKSNTQVKTNLCKINEALWQQCGPNEWKFVIRADRFLRGMVRAIVGTLVLVGQGRLSIREFRTIIEARDRKQAGQNAPAQGLFFAGVQYPNDIFHEHGKK
jgi:tRNA pseudouridine38-40 synthase